MKRWKKWLLYIGTGIIIFTVILFILFCTLIANPFESTYENDLMHLIPQESDVLLYIPDLKQISDTGKSLLPIQQIKATKGFKQFSNTREYRNIEREWQNLLKQQQQIGFEFLKEEYLWKIIKGEVVASVKIEDKQPKILLVARIGFLVRVAEGFSYYAAPKDILTKHNVDFSQSIKKATVEGKKIFWAFSKDLLLFSNDENYIEESWRLLQGSTKSLWNSKNILKNSIRNNHDIFAFVKSDVWKNEITKNKTLMTQLLPIIDINLVEDTLISISLSDRIEANFSIYLQYENVSPYHQKIYQTVTKPLTTDILPFNTYLAGQIPIDISILDQVYNTLPNNIKKEWDNRLHWLNKDHGTSNFLEEKIFKHLKEEINFTCRRIDYIRQDIDIIDPYPAFAFFARTDSPHDFYESIKEILEKEVAKTQGKVKVEEKTYGNRKFLFLDVGGFDFTGGAIQPVFAVIQDYLVFTTHMAFFRSLVDIQDNIAQSWDKSKLYSLKQEYTSPTPIELVVSGNGILSFIEDFKSLWAESIAIGYVNRNPRGRNMEYHKQKLLREWQVYLDYASSIDLNILFNIQPSTELIEIKTNVFFEFNN